MPIYQYHCYETGETIEEFRRMNDEHPDVLIRTDGATGEERQFFRVFGAGIGAWSASPVTNYPRACRGLKGHVKPGDAEFVSAEKTHQDGSKHTYTDLPVVRSAAHERELAEKAGLVKDE